MREYYNKIVNVSFPEIKKDGGLTLTLLRLYSILFLDGASPNVCEKCMFGYYHKIISNGLKVIEFMENKTNVLQDGLHYVRSQAMHFSNNNLSDDKAIELLKSGDLKPAQFKALPKGYTAPKKKEAKEEK